MLSDAEITAQNRNPRWRPSAILNFRKPDHWVPLGCRFSISVKIVVQKCWSTPKLWPTIEIQDGGRPPSWIFENQTSEHWNPLGCLFSITVPNLAQKCWSTPKLWPKIEIQDGGRPTCSITFVLAGVSLLVCVCVYFVCFYFFYFIFYFFLLVCMCLCASITISIIIITRKMAIANKTCVSGKN